MTALIVQGVQEAQKSHELYCTILNIHTESIRIRIWATIYC